eukprot:2234275-Amphidinium_carterae.1
MVAYNKGNHYKRNARVLRPKNATDCAMNIIIRLAQNMTDYRPSPPMTLGLVWDNTRVFNNAHFRERYKNREHLCKKPKN